MRTIDRDIVGAFIFGFAQLIFLYTVICTCFSKNTQKIDDKVWDGAHGLEWTVPSPAPHHTFEIAPIVD